MDISSGVAAAGHALALEQLPEFNARLDKAAL
jgi:hypothetical protein